MTCAYIAFTARGLALAQQLAAACPGSVARGGADGVRLTDWTAAQFAQSDALIFVGAAGIAVRAIAPHCRSKAADPAVVVLDEGGQFAIPLLSGHLGGANELAQRLAAVCHAVPVITTATDGRGVFAVDEWAKRQNCAVAEPERIRYVSGALLAGRSVCYAADWVVSGTPPAGVEPAAAADRADFALTLTPTGEALHLIPRIAVLGVGCKRGTTAEKLETAFAAFCAEHHFAPQGIVRAASIDLKKDEPGLAAFCRSARLGDGLLSARCPAYGERPLYVLRLCAEHHGRGQCLRASGGAGCRRGAVYPEVGAGRRDPCRGAGPLCPGLEMEK